MRKVLSALMAFSTIFLFGCSTDPNTGTTTVIPLAPTNLTATAISTTQVDLAWIDNSTNEAGYKVERKILGGNFAQVASTGANIATYSDLNLTPNTTYIYRVVAYNSAGNSLQYSNEDTVITTLDTMPSSLNNGLIAYYPFNGNAGDSSGNGNHGTVNGATLTTDRFGNNNRAFSFDGNDWIDCGNSSQIDPFSHDYFTISIWYYSLNANTGTFISKYLNGAPSESSFFLMKSPNNIIRTSGNGTNVIDINAITNSWNNLVVEFSRTSGKVRLYQNGSFVTEGAITFNSAITTTNLFIGKIKGIPGYEAFFTGQIDDIRIYNRALTQSEITYLATH